MTVKEALTEAWNTIKHRNSGYDDKIVLFYNITPDDYIRWFLSSKYSARNQTIGRNSVRTCWYGGPPDGHVNKIYGIPISETPLACEKREYQEKSLNVYNFTILGEINYDNYINPSMLTIREYYEKSVDLLKIQLQYQIYADDTELHHTFECDPWKWLKEKLHITKWFPINTKTIKIDCKVLYPKLNIQFPHNTHTVKFKIS